MPPEALSRQGLFSLLLCLLLAVLPHAIHLPTWLSLLVIALLLWRYQVYRGVVSPPKAGLKVLLTLGAAGGIMLSYRPFIGLEPMTALLVIAALLKLLELHRLRDAVLLHYLAYFIVLLYALYDRAMLVGFYQLWVCSCITASLIITQRQGSAVTSWRVWRQGASLLLYALPLAVVMFLVMPRLGSLWSVPSVKHQAKTGVSDSMSPGDFSRLGRSADIAFRVTFTEESPPRSALYWRGLVFSYFDGRQWRRSSEPNQSEAVTWDTQYRDNVSLKGDPLHYSVILEATQQPWLYSLAFAESSSLGVGSSAEFRLLRNEVVSSRFQYQVDSYLRTVLEPQGLSALQRSQLLALPLGFNPQAQELAQQWRKEAEAKLGNVEESLVKRALRLFNQQFYYTLEPPVLGRHSVDEFLFQTRSGFCEHFASAFVVLMRAAGIPARVVAGYQGGELNASYGYIVVRQYDAHAWAEVWLDGRGWVRVDPTAAVAPERIELGLLESLSEQAGLLADSPFSLLHFKQFAWLSSLSQEWDGLNYRWHRFVLGYRGGMQQELLTKLLGGADSWRLGALLLLTLCGVFSSAFGLHLWQTRDRSTLEVRLYRRLCRYLARQGEELRSDDTPRSLCARAISRNPHLQSPLLSILKVFETLEYSDSSCASSQSRRALRKQLRGQIRDLSRF